jgi:L-ascorbate metabolism protein UlaG (beta-lactamase superfamily)
MGMRLPASVLFRGCWAIAAVSAAIPWTTCGQPVANQTSTVTIEYIAHACFRLTSPSGKQILIDPYASRVWIGYDFPADMRADAILISHPHYDHDGGEAMKLKVPWPSNTLVLRTSGTNHIGDITVVGLAGKHADPWGKEFGQSNTIWLVEIAGLRIVHVGDNGPLGEATIRRLGRVDVLMLPIDSEFHILKAAEIGAIRKSLTPAFLIPMHYRQDDLELDPARPEKLGGIEKWAEGEPNVRYLATHRQEFTVANLPKQPEILIFKHSPLVKRPATTAEPAVASVAGALELVGPAIAFRQVHRRWPKDYKELSPMFAQRGQTSRQHEAVQLTELADGSLEILSVDSGQTNRITVPVQ